MEPLNSGFVATLLRRPDASQMSALPRWTHAATLKTPGLTVGLTCYSGVEMLQDAATGITLVLQGCLYEGMTLTRLIDLYRAQGNSYAKALNGSFALLLVDARRGKAILSTDRLGSRSLYLREADAKIEVATQLRYLADAEAPLDPIGLAWYLSNGAVYRNRTLFRDVRRMARASYRCISADMGGCDQIYWEYRFTNEYAGRKREEGYAELSELLVESVRKQVPGGKPIFISLSAGHDVAGIGGILAEKLRVQNVHSFSYGLDERQAGCDAQQARRLAGTLGFQHRFLLSHDGGLFGAIERNARWGDGVSHFCDESLAWQTLLDEFGGQSLPVVVGEHCFGRKKFPFTSKEAVLAYCNIRSLAGMPWIKNLMSHSTYAAFLEGQAEDMSALMNLAPDVESLADFWDIVGLDQRLCHVLLPWRENYAGRAFQVVSPWLDNSLLGFMQKAPASWRDEKSLYKETIRAMLPATFAVPQATQSGYVPDWAAEIAREKYMIIEKYVRPEVASPLDAYIVPKDVRALIATLSDNTRNPAGRLGQIGSASLRMVKRALGISSGGRISFTTPSRATCATFLLRYLVLRRFLEIVKKEAKTQSGGA
jgi:asparagine synthase (glutamine-hydrolysing)